MYNLQEIEGAALKDIAFLDPLDERKGREWIADLKELAWIIDRRTETGPSSDILWDVVNAYLRGRGVKQDKRSGTRRALIMALIISQLLKLCKSDREITGTWVKWDNTLRSIRLAMIKGAEIVAK